MSLRNSYIVVITSFWRLRCNTTYNSKMFEVKERWLILISSKLMNLDYSLDNKDYNFIIGIELSCFTIGKNLFFFISSDLHLLSTRHMWLFHEFHIYITCTINKMIMCNSDMSYFFHFHFQILWISLLLMNKLSCNKLTFNPGWMHVCL